VQPHYRLVGSLVQDQPFVGHERDRSTFRFGYVKELLDQGRSDCGSGCVVDSDQVDLPADGSKPCHLTQGTRGPAGDHRDVAVQLRNRCGDLGSANDHTQVDVADDRVDGVGDERSALHLDHQFVGSETGARPAANYDHGSCGHPGESTLRRVTISTSRLADRLTGDWVAFDRDGNPLEIEIPGDIGPAALLVAPAIDAVKRVHGGTVESLDRDQMWLVEAIVLNRVVLRRIGDLEATAEELLSAVREAGYPWQISPISSP
jgi:hypothetical protein